MKTKVARKGKNLEIVSAITLLLFVFSSSINVVAASSSLVATQPPQIVRTVQIDEDGYRIGVLEGWIAQKLETTDPVIQQREKDVGAMVLFMLCSEDKAIPQIGGTYRPCIEAADYVLLIRFADLESRPEFAGVVQQNYDITISDLLAFFLQYIEQITPSINLTDIKLHENIDMAPVNVTDPQTNQTIGAAPARYVETSVPGGLSNLFMPQILPQFLVLDNTTTTQTTTGYVLVTFNSDLEPELRQIFDSFELLAVNSTRGHLINIH